MKIIQIDKQDVEWIIGIILQIIPIILELKNSKLNK